MPRHPLPAAEKIRRGETRPSRVNFDEPVPRQVRPRMPATLTPEERKVWRAVLRESPPGMVVGLDALALAWLCTAVVERGRCLATYRQAPVPGLLRARGDGRRADAVVVHPVMRPLRYWSEEVRAASDRLGLSPRARAALHVPGDGGILDSIEAAIGEPPRLRVLRRAAGGGDE